MNRSYKSQREFERNNSCACLLEDYLKTLLPPGASYLFLYARQIDENTYMANYKVFSSEGDYSYELQCNMADRNNYQYSFKKTNAR